MNMIEVRSVALPDELEQVYTIRRKVFMEEQEVSLEDEFDGMDEESKHYLATVDGHAAGTARWRRTGHGIKLERFAVIQEFRGKGVAKMLVAQVMKDVLADKSGSERVYLHAQMEAVNLYAREGFEKVGNEFMECNIRHVEMEFRGG